MTDNKKNKQPDNSGEPRWTVGLMLVTPELAQQIVQNNYVNRPINPATVAKYEGDMLANLWIEPTVIYRTADGKLLDGQHRMYALIAARRTLWFVVVDGVDPEIIDAIDGGARRSDPQRLVMHGKPKEVSSLLATMLGFVLNYLRDHRIAPGGVSFPRKWEFQGLYEQMEDYAQYWMDASLDGLHIKKGVLATFHFLTALQDKEKSDDFFGQLLQADNLTEGAPARVLKEYVAKEFPAKGQTQGEVRSSAIALLNAWQAHVEGRFLKKMGPSAEIPRLPVKWPPQSQPQQSQP